MKPARLTTIGVLWLLQQLVAVPAAEPVVFNRDIRPILSDNCLHCHGFDAKQRKADLRLDTVEGATLARQGTAAVVPGKPRESELIRRITSNDPSVVMPPPESGKSLTPTQVSLLQQWIQEGAAYQKHWAFEPPVASEPPAVKQSDWPRDPIDRFILSGLESRRLEPTEAATKETLLRRVTLDLTGLPPTLEELDRFLADESAGAFEAAVDRLLASPTYGEHMARHWLDVARYGDTHGLHLDNERSIWPYRDWVVRAFNQNLPFDQFTIWQLAGDLLPNPTQDHLIASGFNRCNVSTSEGGAIDEEFQVRYAVDRVETTSTAWLGLTMGCAVCHDHKLDPITQKEFYQVYSIFNNMAENAMDGNALLPPPIMAVPNPEQARELADLDSRMQKAREELTHAVNDYDYTDPATLTNNTPQPREIVVVDDDFPAGAQLGTDPGNPPAQWIRSDEGPVFSGDRALKRTDDKQNQSYFSKYDRTEHVTPEDKLFAYVYLDPEHPPKAVMLQLHSDGWKYRANWGDEKAIHWGSPTVAKKQMGPLPKAGEWVRLEANLSELGLNAKTEITGMAFTQTSGTAYWDKAGFVVTRDPAKDPTLSLIAWASAEKKKAKKTGVPEPVQGILDKEPEKRSEGEQKKLRDYFVGEVYASTNVPFLDHRRKLAALRKQRESLQEAIPDTMISKELEKPRPAHILIRGEYDKKGELVGPGVPSVLPPLPQSEQTNRLTFAQWLVSPDHPLTARVTVNRFWQQFFGTGLVKTTEDFGARGDWPSHPELLDWLAIDFVRSGWDVKRLVKQMVTSATYRQDSKISKELMAVDPENRLLGRGPRHRLDAEVLRDYALHVSGLLSTNRGGRGVRTYQPPGIWEAVGYTTSNTAKYSRDDGEALYRRSLYLFWKRTAPPPSMTTFDAPSREQCRTRRERTNTPLQALLTMNDIQYFEAARQLAARMWREGGTTDTHRLRHGFRMTTSRLPTGAEQDVLEEALTAQRTRFTTDTSAAAKVLGVGESASPKDIPASELAAYTLVANLLLNLDEALTKN